MYRPVAPKKEMTKSEMIEVIVVRTPGTPEQQQQLRQALSAYSREELDNYIHLESAKDKLAEITVDIEAERILYQESARLAREPQRKAEEKKQLEIDRATFSQAAKSLRSFGVTEANFNVIRQTLGEGFSVYQIQEMIAANRATLSPPAQEELNEWDHAANEAEILRLKSMDLTSLRKLVREEGARIVGQQPAPDETQRVRQATRADGIVYPPLPEEFLENGKEVVLDAAFIKRSSRKTYKLLLNRYGSDQITEALRTRVPGNTW